MDVKGSSRVWNDIGHERLFIQLTSSVLVTYFAVAYGLWNGSSWAWVITLILCGIAIIVGIGSIVVGHVGSLFLIIINGIVIYYLYRPNVKAYFGK